MNGFYKPAAQFFACITVASMLKKEIADFSCDLYSVAVTLATGFKCRCRGYIQNSINGEFSAIFPKDYPGQHKPIFTELDDDLYILLACFHILLDCPFFDEYNEFDIERMFYIKL